jgi:hypothetical protein
LGARQGASTQGADAGHPAFRQFGLARWQTIDMPQMYWLNLFTVETWKEFLDHGGDVLASTDVVYGVTDPYVTGMP